MDKLTIINSNGQFVVDSREVAEMIGKRHCDLLETVHGYIKILTNGKVRSLDFFIPFSYQDSKKETRPCFEITRKGCDMIANKMTGEKGVLFTASYVTRFEEMERNLVETKPKTKTEIIQAGYQALLEMVDEMKPKAEYFDALVEKNLLTNFRDTAKELKAKEAELVKWLETNKYIYRDTKERIKPYAQHVPALFEEKEYLNPRNNYVGVQTLITPKGRETFRLLLIKDGYIKQEGK